MNFFRRRDLGHRRMPIVFFGIPYEPAPVERSRGTLLAFLLLSLLFPQPARSSTPYEITQHPIRSGQPDDQVPEVLGLRRTEGTIFCSGVLVAPRLVLSAGHCLSRPGPISLVLGGQDTPEGAAPAVIARRAHPRFGGDDSDNDAGVLFLSRTAAVSPAVMGGEPPAAGSEVFIVGFGRADAPGSAGTRRSGKAIVKSVTENVLELEAGPARPCYGDSGGAVFQRGPSGDRVLVGVLMEGDESCESTSLALRLDRQVDGFIRPMLRYASAAEGRGGDPCLTGDQCASGMCQAPSGAQWLGYCSGSCAGTASCESPLTCDRQSATCARKTDLHAVTGEPCSQDLACATGYCRLEGTDSGMCTTSCFPGDEPCPGGLKCAASQPGAPGLFECVPAGSPGGCSFSPNVRRTRPTPPVLAMVLLGLWGCRQSSRGRHRPGSRP
jgi:hypothetical protein